MKFTDMAASSSPNKTQQSLFHDLNLRMKRFVLWANPIPRVISEWFPSFESNTCDLKFAEYFFFTR